MTTISGRYILGEVIGTGGMSDVYAAHDELLGRDVAIKILRIELARDVNFRERFRREAQNSGKLNHPSIVSVYDTGETPIDDISVPYIVMERVVGRTLRDLLQKDGAIEPAAAAAMLIPVCEALQASHDAHIIHRDIKPANIMITNTGTVKVMDFGIARALDDSTSAMTQTSAVIGTAQYLSPEQARGKSADGRSDVYALGCVLYEMLTLRPPFEGETPFAVAYQHVQEDPEPPSSYIPDLTPTQAVNVDAVVLTAMAKHPGDRYQTAADMGRDLKLLSTHAVTRAARTYVASTANGNNIPGAGVAGVTGVTQVVTTAGQDYPTSEQPAITDAMLSATALPTSTTVPARRASGGGATGGGGGGKRRRAEPADKSQQSHVLRWLAALLSVVVLGVGGAFAYDYFIASDGKLSGHSTVEVPDISNMSTAQAQKTLENAGFLVELTEEPNPTVKRGLALRTNPVAGSFLQRGTTVNLVVSTGREETDVPNLKGKTLEEAQDALHQVGLELSTIVREEKSEDIAEGDIISQSPLAGKRAAKGSEVTVTVSLGSAKIKVPELAGVHRSEATETLKSLGFEVEVTMVDSRQPAQFVIAVSDSGTEKEKGSVITLTVSRGNLMNMPDITGMTYPNAVQMLRDAGWRGRLAFGETVKTPLITDADRIAASSPSPGEDLHIDGGVTVRLWTFDLSALAG